MRVHLAINESTMLFAFALIVALITALVNARAHLMSRVRRLEECAILDVLENALSAARMAITKYLLMLAIVIRPRYDDSSKICS
jgi:hypothetical protein